MPRCMPPHREPHERTDAGGNTVRRFRPNTGTIRMPAALLAIYDEFTEVVDRFQYLGGE